MSKARVQLPPKLLPLFTPPRGSLRYRGAFGGRGSAKSFSFAKMAAVWGYAEPLRILCTRDLQVSIKSSFHAELKHAIASEPWLEASYDVGIDYLRGNNGTEFIFRGLRHNIGGIKSMAQIDLCIVEEAEDVPERSWVDLEPTIRAPKSEIWCLWNPRDRNSPVNKRFRENPPPRSCFVEMNWRDNPWFPTELEEQRQHAESTMDPALYRHIWEGDYYEASEAEVLHGKWAAREFEVKPHWNGPFYGLDFGFANDPTAAVECWIGDGRLWIRAEAVKVGLELDDTSGFIKDAIPGFELEVSRADSARPESISYLRRHGLPRVEAVQKWPGSVEDGIAHLRSYREIVIHPECKHAIDEARNYRYHVDRLTGDITSRIVDAHNHVLDAVRYCLAPLIRQNDRKTMSMQV